MVDVAEIIKNKPEEAVQIHHEQILDFLESIKNLFSERKEFPLIRLRKHENKNIIVYFVGDTHGDHQTSVKIGKNLIVPTAQTTSSSSLTIFLGDYIDRPPGDLNFGSVINILYLFSLKYLYPDRIYLLRGNHEAYDMLFFGNYEFPDELQEVFGDEPGRKIHQKFQEIFSLLPIFVQLDNGVFASHGGFPKETTDINNVTPSDTTAISQTLWGDPEEANTYRGDISDMAMFNRKELGAFLDAIGSMVMIRSHDRRILGRPMGDERLITIFSSRISMDSDDDRILIARVDLEKSIDMVSKLDIIDLSRTKLSLKN